MELFERHQGGERTLLIHVTVYPGPQHDPEEFRLLAQSAGAQILGEYPVNRSRADPRLLIGEGKAQEIAAQVKADDIEGRARTATATAILATSKAWERREIGEGWGRLTARIDGSGLAAVTCQHATFTAIEALENAFGGEWRYVGFAVSERVFRKVS